ncbi:type IV pilus biogenesis protein PilM [candidate division KSB1 bacterium]
MPRVTQTNKIGLSLGPQESFLVTVDGPPNRQKVTNLFDIDLGAPFIFEAVSEIDILETIGQNLKDTLLAEGITSDDIYISLDYSMAMIKNLPVDDTLKESELKEHVLWEMEQHVISPIPDYSFDFQKISKAFSSHYPSVLLVTVKKQIIDAVKTIAETADLNLNLIDINVFSVVNALEKNYSLKSNEKVVSVGIGQESLLFTILKGTNFLGFHPVQLEKEDDLSNISLENIYSEITKNLRFFISDYETEDGKKEFDRIFVYKIDKTIDINELLSVETDSPFEILNPLKKMSILPKLKDRMDPLSDYSEFTTSVGLVVRD